MEIRKKDNLLLDVNEVIINLIYAIGTRMTQTPLGNTDKNKLK